MTIEKIYEDLKNITNNEEYIKLPKLLEELEKSIRENTCYKTYSKTRIKAIERIAIKNEDRPSLTGYGLLNDYKIITDSYHLVAIKQDDMPLKLVATDEDLKKYKINKEEYIKKYGVNSIINATYPDVHNIIDFDKNKCNKIEINVDDIASFYKLNKKDAKTNLYELGKNLYNIKFIKNIIDVLGSDVEVYESGQLRPLFFQNKNNEIGLVLPCRRF